MNQNALRTIMRVISMLLLLPVGALAAGNGGSIYSRFGIGDLRYGYSAQSLGMAETGLSIRSMSNIDQTNPASWSSINRTRWTIGALYEGYSSTDGISSTRLGSAEFNGAMIAFPIAPKSGVVFAGGITPYSRVNYNTVTPSSQGGLDYTLHFIGTGGLSAAHAGFSASLTDELHAGIQLQYYFGSLKHTVQQSFSGSDYTSAEVIRSTQLRGTGLTLGLIYTGLSGVLRLPETDHFSVGGFFSTAAHLSSDQDDFLKYVAGGLTTYDTSTVASGSNHLPLSAGAGISYATERVTVGADMQYQNWNAYTDRGIHPTELRDSYRYSGGMELAARRDPTAPFTQRMAFRAGLFYNQTYYILKNQPVNEYGVSAGTGIPIFGETRLHIGAEYSLRGTTDLQLQKDKILRFSFTVTGGELWFVRPAEE